MTKKTTDVSVEKLVFDEKYQMREELPSIDEYAAMLEESGDQWPFAHPIRVRQVRSKFYVLEGFTRGRAAQKAGRETVQCEVVECTEPEAFKIALGSNAEHGYRRTNRDKRKAVLKAYGKWPGYSSTKLAELCKVSHTYVHNVVNKLKDQPNGEAIEYEAAPEEPTTVQLGECPCCKADDWEEREEGIICAVCRHPHGESAGTDEDEQEELASPKAPASKVVNTAPSSNGAGKVDMRREKIKQAQTEMGRFIRTMAEIDWLPGVEEKCTDILMALKKALK